MNWNEYSDLESKGYTILKNRISLDWILSLSFAMDRSFLRREKNGESKGVALHVLLDELTYLDFLSLLINDGFIDELRNFYFNNSPCILNSFSALNNLPNQSNFSSIIHRDLRFYSGDFPIMLNCLVMIDDFTKENGGTYLLPGSHLKENKPTDDYFYKNAIQAVGKAGDILLFNSNVWHAAAPNKTDKGRKAIPITISRSFMKQLLDYPRALGYDKVDKFRFNKQMQQFLGYDSRVPASLEEWNQPKDKRFYKKDQD